ncbi:DsbA family protein [uncultured Bacteroides sp.]|uniref:DsbA family protein n=1 Tax=uncultured Bacteroides sp. TaxID=162156 RepID=UPI002AA8A7B4|nr:DsbA family protein [uncultured Bacteroides sp.]
MSDVITINTLMCSPETGVCESPETKTEASNMSISPKKSAVHILYFSDPICSACWGIEPQLRKLKMEYDNYYEIEYKMGGLLPSWDIDSKNKIKNPVELAHHWEEVGDYYGMPIDGDIWLEDPLSSSYPPSIAFKAAQLQNEEQALKFYRRIKEMLFLEKRNIAKWEWIEKAALESELDIDLLKTDFEGEAQRLFQEDLEISKKMGVRGFPTLFFSNAEGKQLVIYGVRPYMDFEEAMLKLCPQAIKQPINKTHEGLFDYYPTLTTHEFAVLTDRHENDALDILNNLHKLKYIEKYLSKKGALWIRR